MTIALKSTTDSKEAVIAALGDLAPQKTDDGTIKESKTKEEVDPQTQVKDVEAKTESESESEVDSEIEENENLGLETKSEDEAPKTKKKGGFQKRIDKLNKRNQEIEQEKEYWRQEALRGQQSAPKNETKLEPAKQLANGKPDPEKYETHDEYVEALTDWKLDQKLAAKETASKQNDIKSAFQKKVDTHLARVNSFKESHTDFDEAIESVNDVQISLSVQESILDSDHGPELMYELAKDPEEYRRICNLPAIAAARAIGRIEAKFSKNVSESSGKKTTKVPEPVNPVRARGATSTKSIYDADKLTQKEYEQLRREQLKQNSMRR